MSLVSIGPVTISHGDPSFSVAASSTGHAIESMTIGGSCSWPAAQTLRELIGNETARITKAGHTGVLEWLVFDDTLMASLTGYYLLESFAINAAQKDSLTAGDVPFTLSAAFVGDLPDTVGGGGVGGGGDIIDGGTP